MCSGRRNIARRTSTLRKWQPGIFAFEWASGFARCGRQGSGTRTTWRCTSALAGPYISNVERGNKNPSLRSLEIFALGFGMTLSEFLKDV